MPPEQMTNPLMQFAPFIFIFLIFYFIVIRPEKNKQKEHKEKVAAIKKNDEVVSAGGIHGTVVNLKPKTVIVRVDDNVKLEIDREAIATVNPKP